MMARTAKEEWERLNQSVNCRHYIGTNSWNTINDAISSTEEHVEESTPETTEGVVEGEDAPKIRLNLS